MNSNPSDFSASTELWFLISAKHKLSSHWGFSGRGEEWWGSAVKHYCLGGRNDNVWLTQDSKSEERMCWRQIGMGTVGGDLHKKQCYFFFCQNCPSKKDRIFQYFLYLWAKVGVQGVEDQTTVYFQGIPVEWRRWKKGVEGVGGVGGEDKERCFCSSFFMILHWNHDVWLEWNLIDSCKEGFYLPMS